MTAIGTTLCATGATPTVFYYGPWFPRQGDAATFVCETVFANSPTAKVYIETKNSADADPSAGGTELAVSNTAGASSYVRVTALKELVRYRYSIAGTVDKWIHCRMLEPCWETN